MLIKTRIKVKMSVFITKHTFLNLFVCCFDFEGFYCKLFVINIWNIDTKILTAVKAFFAEHFLRLLLIISLWDQK